MRLVTGESNVTIGCRRECISSVCSQVPPQQTLLFRAQMRLFAHFGHPGVPQLLRIAGGFVRFVASNAFGGVEFVGLAQFSLRNTGVLRGLERNNGHGTCFCL